MSGLEGEKNKEADSPQTHDLLGVTAFDGVEDVADLPGRVGGFSFFTNEEPEEEDVEQLKKDFGVLVNRIRAGKKKLIGGLTLLNNLVPNEEGMFESSLNRVFCTYEEVAYAIKEGLREGVIRFNNLVAELGLKRSVLIDDYGVKKNELEKIPEKLELEAFSVNEVSMQKLTSVVIQL